MLRIISYNIRYNNPADGVNAWPNRQAAVATLLHKYQPDLIGLQEVRHEQLVALATALPDYAWIGVGRDDGAQAGEYAPIFYRRDRLTIQESGHFWLSETPDMVGSFGWDADCVRVATWAIFQEQSSGQSVFHLNTHFDHRGMIAQQESVTLLHRFLAKRAAELPAIVTGDFNCTPASATYLALTALANGELPHLHDAMYQSELPHEGPTATFTTDFADPLQEKIDYIFLYTGQAATHHITVERHAILADQANSHYPSDHLPVLAEINWVER
jgi:endonuclease/exonuclease/phosphatase family metal-dependent hydrolase